MIKTKLRQLKSNKKKSQGKLASDLERMPLLNMEDQF